MKPKSWAWTRAAAFPYGGELGCDQKCSANFTFLVSLLASPLLTSSSPSGDVLWWWAPLTAQFDVLPIDHRCQMRGGDRKWIMKEKDIRFCFVFAFSAILSIIYKIWPWKLLGFLSILSGPNQAYSSSVLSHAGGTAWHTLNQCCSAPGQLRLTSCLGELMGHQCLSLSLGD